MGRRLVEPSVMAAGPAAAVAADSSSSSDSSSSFRSRLPVLARVRTRARGAALLWMLVALAALRPACCAGPGPSGELQASDSDAPHSIQPAALPPLVFPKSPSPETAYNKHLTVPASSASGPLPSRTFPASRAVIISTASPSGLVLSSAVTSAKSASDNATHAAMPVGPAGAGGGPAGVAGSPADAAAPSASAPSSKKTPSPFLEPSKSALVLAAIFASVSLAGYLGLLLWRRVLERKYGNREALVNDDDCYDVGDLKHFEL